MDGNKFMNMMEMASWMELRIGKCPHGSSTFFETDAFPWVREVEAKWTTIRKELDVLLEHKEQIPNLQDISPEQSSVASGESWKTFFLYGFGHKIEKNCACCPETAHIVSKIPGLKMAMFSILAPKSHIPPHRGPYRGLLRYHLGLIIPPPVSNCRLRVADEIRSWQEGRSLIFDDSFDHEAWNDSDRHRVVLFVDFVRPLPISLSLMNHLMIWQISKLPFVMDAVRRLRGMHSFPSTKPKLE
jgi:ornithine lipid ester-linked acyl 2-hydroxylase